MSVADALETASRWLTESSRARFPALFGNDAEQAWRWLKAAGAGALPDPRLTSYAHALPAAKEAPRLDASRCHHASRCGAISTTRW